MRVAQVMAGAVHGGAELFFERLCRGLHEGGNAVLPVIRRNPARAAALQQAGLSPVELRFGSRLDVVTRLRLGAALRQFAPRVVVSWMNRATLHTPRGDWVHVGRLGGYYPLRHYRRCDHLVGNTQGIVAWLRAQGWPEERTHHLPNFTRDFGSTAQAADLAGEGPLLLGLGRLHTDKGFDTVLHALARLPSCRLAIAGSGPERGRLARLAARLGVAERVQFLGWRDDAGALLRACDVFVCSSRIEPLGNMVIEAWSAGTPVVAVASRGPAELIRDRQDGRLTPLEDAEALAGAIAATLADAEDRARMVASGRLRFEQDYSEAVVLARWQTFLERVGA